MGNRALCSIVFCLGLAGCGSHTVTKEETACLDLATAVGDAAMRCGQDAKANRDAFVNAVGGCESIKQLRDEGSLRMTCIPSLMTISCDDLIAGMLDDSCKGQLLK